MEMKMFLLSLLVFETETPNKSEETLEQRENILITRRETAGKEMRISNKISNKLRKRINNHLQMLLPSAIHAALHLRPKALQCPSCLDCYEERKEPEHK